VDSCKKEAEGYIDCHDIYTAQVVLACCAFFALVTMVLTACLHKRQRRKIEGLPLILIVPNEDRSWPC
jgi:hypothetical protein